MKQVKTNFESFIVIGVLIMAIFLIGNKMDWRTNKTITITIITKIITTSN